MTEAYISPCENSLEGGDGTIRQTLTGSVQRR
jgi:hypothetical protein